MIAATNTGVVPMRVSKAVWVRHGEANAHFMVLDDLDGDRHLVIPICQAQAFDLAASLQGWQLGRPLTYQFTAALVRGLDGRVVDVTLDRIVEEVAYAATVKVEGPQRTALVDARASDALNLAVLTDAPVFAAPDAQTDYTAPSSTTSRWRWGTPPRSGMRRLIAPWEYRHLRACARVRAAAGVVLVGLCAVTLFGGSFSAKAVGFAALFLVAAAASFAWAAWDLAIARSIAAI